jgi:hypothetical protein
LERSIYVKAREKMNKAKDKSSQNAQEAEEKDYLIPILKKLSLPLDQEL